MATSSPYGLFGTAFGGGTSTASNPNNPFNTYKPGSLGAQAASPAANVSAPSNMLPKGATALPTMAQTNSTFMKNNPQYSTGLMTPPGSASAAATQQAADMAKYFPNGISGSTTTPPAQTTTPTKTTGTGTGTPPQNSGTGNDNTNTGYNYTGVDGNVYNSATGKLVNTKVNSDTTAAVGTSQGIATNQGASAPGGTPGAYANTATTGLLGLAAAPSPEVTAAENAYKTFATQSPWQVSAMQNNPNMLANIATGNAANMSNAAANEQNALAAGVSQAQTTQGQQITAANEAGATANTTQNQQISAAQNAGNLANTAQSNQINAQSNAGNLSQPTQLPYGTQYGTPQQLMNGQGQGQGGNLSPQNTASNYAAQVIAGTKSYDDAKSAMGYAGSAGQAMLDQAIQQQKPGFNVNQAQVNSATQGALAPQGSVATGELNNLQTSMGQMTNVMGFLPQNTSIPVVNAFTRWVGGLVGNASTQNLNDAASAARSAVATALGTAYNTTPTDFTGQVNAWFPQGASTAQIQQGVDSFNALMKVRQASFSSPGTASFTPAGNAGTTGNWPGWNP